MAERPQLLALATEIVSAQVSHNAVAVDQLPGLIQQVFNALATAEQAVTAPPKAEPAVAVRRSIFADHIVCLDCGKHLSMLKRHLMTDHKMTPEQYRQRWELPFSYPLVAPNYAKARSALAKKFGLGRRGQPHRRKRDEKLPGRRHGRDEQWDRRHGASGQPTVRNPMLRPPLPPYLTVWKNHRDDDAARVGDGQSQPSRNTS